MPQLVTGGRGFAGRHLVRLIGEEGGEALAPSREQLDLLDPAATAAAVRDARPEVVFHLAAFASPGRSWDEPREAVMANVEMTLNLLEAVRHEAPDAVVVLVTSGQVYGTEAGLPLTESAPLEPANPYALSKVTADMLGAQYAAGYELQVVRMRPFNHAGPGQSEEYVLSSLAAQVARAEAAGEPEAVLRTGDVSARRDFTDVRDVVRAYALGARLEPGAYNVCSGSSVAVADLIEMVGAAARIPVRHEIDPTRLRPVDVSDLYGSHDRLTAACGWEPRIPLEQTVADALEAWRATPA